MQQELEMEELGLEPHPEEDEDLAVEDNHGKIILLTPLETYCIVLLAMTTYYC